MPIHLLAHSVLRRIVHATVGGVNTHAGSTDKVYYAASDIFFISGSLGRNTIKQSAKHIPSLAHWIHVARNNWTSGQLLLHEAVSLAILTSRVNSNHADVEATELCSKQLHEMVRRGFAGSVAGQVHIRCIMHTGT